MVILTGIGMEMLLMSENIDLIWCDDCKCFVGELHRCQQWETTHRIPAAAARAIATRHDSELLEETVKSLESIRSLCIKNLLTPDNAQGYLNAIASIRTSAEEILAKLTEEKGE